MLIHPLKILLVNSTTEHCGVNDFGFRVYRCLKPSSLFEISHGKYDNERNLFESLVRLEPTHVMINKHVSTMNFISDDTLAKIKEMGIRTILMPHDEIVQYQDKLLDHIAWLDPTLENIRPNEFRLQRPIIRLPDEISGPSKLTVGYSGWLFRHKRVELLIDIFRDFDCEFNIHYVPYENYRDYGYEDYIMSRFNNCGKKATFNNEFLTEEGLTQFYSQNSINVFPYEDRHVINRGLSSATDYALASRRPFLISNSNMFRHFSDIVGRISIYQFNLADILENHNEFLSPYLAKWSPEKMQKTVYKALMGV